MGNCALVLLLAVLVAFLSARADIEVDPAEGGAGIVRALEKARTIHRVDAKTAVVIELIAGDYLLDSPIEFGAADSNLRIRGAKVPGTTGRVKVVRLVGMGVARGCD